MSVIGHRRVIAIANQERANVSAPASPLERSQEPTLTHTIGIGTIGGLLSGLLGIGGGTVMVPLMVFWAHMTQRSAHALSLMAILPISVVAVIAYGVAGDLDVLSAVALAAGSMTGARVGTSILARAPERTLKLAFGAFMLVAAAAVVTKG